MKILLSNDDGVYAEGIAALYEVLSDIAHVDVVAPDRNRSGASNSLSLHVPLRVRQLPNGFYSVEGTPTDCVHLALTGFLKERPDILVTGINDGSNLGDDVLYSGTVAAATEGRFLGLPSLAVSLAGKEGRNYLAAARIIKNLILNLDKMPVAGKNTILNINIPDLPLESIKGYEVTRLGTRHSAEPMIEQKDPRGHRIYWVGPPGQEADAGPGSDFYAVNESKVSITPLLIDFTNHVAMLPLREWVHELPLPFLN